MNFIKQCLTTALLLLCLPTIAQHSYPTQKANADSAWSKLVAHSDSDKDFITKQTRLLKYREDGLKFWKMFPNDPRRYKWLYYTLKWSPQYWKIKGDTFEYKHFLNSGIYNPIIEYNLPLENQKLKDWESGYPELRATYINYLSLNPQFSDPYMNPSGEYKGYGVRLIQQELFQFLTLSLNRAYRKGNKINLDKLRRLFLESGKYLTKAKLDSPTYAMDAIFNPMDACFISMYEQFGLNGADMSHFFDSIKGCSYPILRNWAIQRSSLFALMKEPFTLKHQSINGGLIDLERMKGKVVLIDFWSTNCASCIARMPAIKTVYDKYKDQGFEVISTCLADDDLLDSVKKIDKKIGADWPLLMIGEYSNKNSLGRFIWNKYGFWGVPQLLLLNKEGKLVMLNDKLRSGDFEPLIKQLLTEKYDAN